MTAPPSPASRSHAPARRMQTLRSVGLALVLVALLVITTVLLIRWTSSYAQAEMETDLAAISRTAISLLDKPRIAKLSLAAPNPNAPDFTEIRAELRHIRESTPAVRFVYLLALRGPNFIFLVDAEPDDSPSYSPPGQILADYNAPNTLGIRRALATNRVVVTRPYNDRWGRWVSALTPLLNGSADGGPTVVLGVDVAADHWESEIQRYRKFGILISALVSAIVLLATAMVIMEQRSRRKLQLEIAHQKVLEFKLRELSQLDSLTRVANRRRFDEVYDRVWREALLTGQPIALLMADLDKFKAYNDAYGHIAGDHTLNCIAQTIAQMVRADDLVARYGGEEFVIVLPGASEQTATAIADSIRSAIATLRIPHSGALLGYMTVSIGVAARRGDEIRNAQELLALADRALYEAKALTGNVVVSL